MRGFGDEGGTSLQHSTRARSEHRTENTSTLRLVADLDVSAWRRVPALIAVGPVGTLAATVAVGLVAGAVGWGLHRWRRRRTRSEIAK